MELRSKAGLLFVNNENKTNILHTNIYKHSGISIPTVYSSIFNDIYVSTVCESVCGLFYLTQGHWGVKINPEPRIEGLSECAVECVQVGQCVRGDCVEGQSAGRPVQIHSYSVGAGGGGRYGSFLLIVPDRVTVTITLQTPGLVIVSKPTVLTPSTPADSFICHCYINPPSSTPLCLPVTAPRQTLSTQHLWPALKSLWVIRIRLLLCPPCHLSVLLRQREVSLCCVWVQCELTGIWWGRPRHNILLIIIIHIRISSLNWIDLHPIRST